MTLAGGSPGIRAGVGLAAAIHSFSLSGEVTSASTIRCGSLDAVAQRDPGALAPGDCDRRVALVRRGLAPTTHPTNGVAMVATAPREIDVLHRIAQTFWLLVVVILIIIFLMTVISTARPPGRPRREDRPGEMALAHQPPLPSPYRDRMGAFNPRCPDPSAAESIAPIPASRQAANYRVQAAG